MTAKHEKYRNLPLFSLHSSLLIFLVHVFYNSKTKKFIFEKECY